MTDEDAHEDSACRSQPVGRQPEFTQSCSPTLPPLRQMTNCRPCRCIPTGGPDRAPSRCGERRHRVRRAAPRAGRSRKRRAEGETHQLSPILQSQRLSLLPPVSSHRNTVATPAPSSDILPPPPARAERLGASAPRSAPRPSGRCAAASEAWRGRRHRNAGRVARATPRSRRRQLRDGQLAPGGG